MAENGEWNSKGATLSDITAHKEYGVNRDFILNGIKSGKLEFREGSMWGNPYLRVLRSQLERYIIDQLGPDYLTDIKLQTELHMVNKEIAAMKKKLGKYQARKAEIEKLVRL